MSAHRWVSERLVVSGATSSEVYLVCAACGEKRATSASRTGRCKSKAPAWVDPTLVPGTYYLVERFGRNGWQQVGTGSYRTALEAQWVRAKLHVGTNLPISATRVVSWRWS